MTLVASFTIPGKPVPKARPRFDRKSGRAFTPAKSRKYERRVASEADAASRWELAGGALQRRQEPWPSRKDCAREKATQRAGKSSKCRCAFCASRVEIDLKIFVPDKRARDLDNITKSVLDGMNRVLFRDDSQVLQTSISKALDRVNPRVEVVVRLFPPAQEKLGLEEPTVELDTCPECEGAGSFEVTLPVTGKKRSVVCGPCQGSGKVQAR